MEQAKGMRVLVARFAGGCHSEGYQIFQLFPWKETTILTINTVYYKHDHIYDLLQRMHHQAATY